MKTIRFICRLNDNDHLTAEITERGDEEGDVFADLTSYQAGIEAYARLDAEQAHKLGMSLLEFAKEQGVGSDAPAKWTESRS